MHLLAIGIRAGHGQWQGSKKRNVLRFSGLSIPGNIDCEFEGLLTLLAFNYCTKRRPCSTTMAKPRASLDLDERMQQAFPRETRQFYLGLHKDIALTNRELTEHGACLACRRGGLCVCSVPLKNITHEDVS